MSKITYSIDLEKVNPQFVGIAGKYNSHKKNRLSLQRQKNRLDLNANYLINLNQNLNKEVQHKKKQLKRVQQIHNRLNNDTHRKMLEQEKRKKNLQLLHKKSLQAKIGHQQNLKKAQENLLNEKKQQKQQVSSIMKALNSQLFLSKSEAKTQNAIRFQSIQYDKKVGQDNVNQFYRKKNKQSLNSYLSLIKTQDQKSQQYQKEILKLRSTISNFSTKVSKKKKEVDQLNESITLYAGPTNTRNKYRGFRLQILSQKSERSNCSTKSNPKDIILGKALDLSNVDL